MPKTFALGAALPGEIYIQNRGSTMFGDQSNCQWFSIGIKGQNKILFTATKLNSFLSLPVTMCILTDYNGYTNALGHKLRANFKAVTQGHHINTCMHVFSPMPPTHI